jgi:hypothetical protein
VSGSITTGFGTGNYHCVAVTVVDRPWLRDTSYAVVPAGFRIITTGRFPTAGAAVREMERLLRGESDFMSEYIRSVEVFRADNRRTIRRRVERARLRDADRHELLVTALAARADHRGNTWVRGSAAWDLERTWDDESAELLAA